MKLLSKLIKLLAIDVDPSFNASIKIEKEGIIVSAEEFLKIRNRIVLVNSSVSKSFYIDKEYVYIISTLNLRGIIKYKRK